MIAIFLKSVRSINILLPNFKCRCEEPLVETQAAETGVTTLAPALRARRSAGEQSPPT